MDFQIIQFLDNSFVKRIAFRGSKRMGKPGTYPAQLMADYQFIITEYQLWEQEEFERKVGNWEQEACAILPLRLATRHYALAA